MKRMIMSLTIIIVVGCILTVGVYLLFNYLGWGDASIAAWITGIFTIICALIDAAVEWNKNKSPENVGGRIGAIIDNSKGAEVGNVEVKAGVEGIPQNVGPVIKNSDNVKVQDTTYEKK